MAASADSPVDVRATRFDIQKFNACLTAPAGMYSIDEHSRTKLFFQTSLQASLHTSLQAPLQTSLKCSALNRHPANSSSKRHCKHPASAPIKQSWGSRLQTAQVFRTQPAKKVSPDQIPSSAIFSAIASGLTLSSLLYFSHLSLSHTSTLVDTPII